MLLLSPEEVVKLCFSSRSGTLKNLTTRIVLEILAHEALVRQAYKDSAGVWTWGVGITDASGHSVFPRYQDKPQTLRWCLELYLRVLKNNYLPAVLETFDRHDLEESKLGAALSFHYNTGAIRQATWVKQWKCGDVEAAKQSFMNWCKPPQVLPRREKERDLFFDGVWSSDGQVMEYSVHKTTYAPDPTSLTRIDVSSILSELLAE